MFWDKVSGLYDFFENVYNGKVYKELGLATASFVSEGDSVLECACGTGKISYSLAQKCASLIATDFSDGMLRQARKRCAKLQNVEFRSADIMHLEFADAYFDSVVAGNVIHLLDDPQGAIRELERVCKPGGKIIIPTYVNIADNGKPNFGARFLQKLGLDFKKHFSLDTYKQFFVSLGYENVEYKLVEGKMPCAIAVVRKMV